MKIAKRAVTVALLLFVGATVGMLVAQEVMHSEVAAVEDAGPSTEPVVETGSDVAAQPSAVAPEESPATGDPASAGGNAASSCVVDAIYFHNTLRCYTCRNIEETSRAVLEAEFPGELAEGRLRWSVVNMEKQRHYVDQYSLVMPTLVLVRSAGGEPLDWVALDETWTLIRSELRFSMYVKDSTREFLEGCE
ncbi:MAG: nitrophenyl compound nitroreductase subunit ArsF family protein [Candidatus Bipolaricaulia bacterium]